MEEKVMSLREHLEELRKVLIISLVTLVFTTVVSYFLLREQIMAILLEPVKPFKISLVYITFTEAFLTQLKASLLAGIVLAIPIILWQIWSFIVPALKPQEKKYILLLVPVSTILFIGGILFAYKTVFRLAVQFFIIQGGVVPGLTPMISISKYFSFLISFLIPFGLIFQLPLVIIFLTRIGVVNHRLLAANRKYVLLLIFTVAAILTPPDVISQILMGGPMYLLYEVSIWLSRLAAVRSKRMVQEQDT
ncbi:twin-arginine translocase subunit TatC [Calderihabitans maritimus]|uniref:Sec-independent protein translocase protein TatC n=1 Tax=Calderihabitans maritimus TaxID=1246530 RepID=A0A1Z5HNN5_9FIRM|nr:twin-arginine translocase subunit TatC [Calderihabitans maritimus]GAW91124.1 Sec-independent protein secretion pathway component TatC [Calderihabitans maritimus]